MFLLGGWGRSRQDDRRASLDAEVSLDLQSLSHMSPLPNPDDETLSDEKHRSWTGIVSHTDTKEDVHVEVMGDSVMHRVDDEDGGEKGYADIPLTLATTEISAAKEATYSGEVTLHLGDNTRHSFLLKNPEEISEFQMALNEGIAIANGKALHEALAAQNVSRCEEVRSKVRDRDCSRVMDMRNGDGLNPVHVVARLGSIELLQYLEDRFDADLMQTDVDGNTVVHHAVLGEHMAFIEHLRQRGEEIDQEGRPTISIPFLTADPPAPYFTRLINIRNDAGKNPLHLAECDEEIAQRLLDAGIDISIMDNLGLTPLMQQASGNNFPAIRRILHTEHQHRCAIDSRCSDLKNTALMISCKRGSFRSVLTLLKNGANTSYINVFNENAMHLACKKYVDLSWRRNPSSVWHRSFVNVLQALIAYAPMEEGEIEGIDHVAEDGETPLLILCSSPMKLLQGSSGELACTAAVEALADLSWLPERLKREGRWDESRFGSYFAPSPANLMARDLDGYTCLIVAAQYGNYLLVELLIRLARKRDPPGTSSYSRNFLNAVGNDGFTALGYCARKLEAMEPDDPNRPNVQRTEKALLNAGALERMHDSVPVEADTADLKFMSSKTGGSYQLQGGLPRAIAKRLVHPLLYTEEDALAFVLHLHQLMPSLELVEMLHKMWGKARDNALDETGADELSPMSLLRLSIEEDSKSEDMDDDEPPLDLRRSSEDSRSGSFILRHLSKTASKGNLARAIQTKSFFLRKKRKEASRRGSGWDARWSRGLAAETGYLSKRDTTLFDDCTGIIRLLNTLIKLDHGFRCVASYDPTSPRDSLDLGSVPGTRDYEAEKDTRKAAEALCWDLVTTQPEKVAERLDELAPFDLSHFKLFCEATLDAADLEASSSIWAVISERHVRRSKPLLDHVESLPEAFKRLAGLDATAEELSTPHATLKLLKGKSESEAPVAFKRLEMLSSRSLTNPASTGSADGGAFFQDEASPSPRKEERVVLENESIPPLTSYNSLDVAVQLTIMTHSLFSKISLDEFVDKNFARHGTSPRFHALKQFSRRIQYRLISEVLQQATHTERSDVILHYMRIVDDLIRKGNDTMAKAIIEVLGCAAIHRLRKTWTRLFGQVGGKWEEMQEANGPGGRELDRKMLDNDRTVPSMGGALKMIINIAEESRFIDKEERLVNFSRLRKIARVLNMLHVAQGRVLHMEPDSEIMHTLLSPPAFEDDEECYRQSLVLEPREQRRQRRRERHSTQF